MSEGPDYMWFLVERSFGWMLGDKIRKAVQSGAAVRIEIAYPGKESEREVIELNPPSSPSPRSPA